MTDIITIAKVLIAPTQTGVTPQVVPLLAANSGGAPANASVAPPGRQISLTVYARSKHCAFGADVYKLIALFNFSTEFVTAHSGEQGPF